MASQLPAAYCCEEAFPTHYFPSSYAVLDIGKSRNDSTSISLCRFAPFQTRTKRAKEKQTCGTGCQSKTKLYRDVEYSCVPKQVYKVVGDPKLSPNFKRCQALIPVAIIPVALSQQQRRKRTLTQQIWQIIQADVYCNMTLQSSTLSDC